MKRIVAHVYALFFYPALVVYTAVAIPLLAGVGLAATPFISRQANMRRFRRMIACYGYGVVCGLARPIIRTVYESPARSPREVKIFVSNHVSSSDPFLVSLLPEPVVQVVNLWPFKLPVWGPFARWAGYLNIRAMDPEAFQSAAARLLAEGTSIVAFPEGTRAGERPMGPFHGALFRLALATHTPIVPMCITGNARSPARGSLLLEPAVVRVRCLPELAWEDFREMTPFQLKNHVHRLIQQAITQMEVPA